MYRGPILCGYDAHAEDQSYEILHVVTHSYVQSQVRALYHVHFVAKDILWRDLNIIFLVCNDGTGKV